MEMRGGGLNALSPPAYLTQLGVGGRGETWDSARTTPP